jgi:hypothetical protein
MIDGSHDVKKCESQIRASQAILGQRWELFELSDEIIAEIPDSPAKKRWTSGKTLDPLTAHKMHQTLIRV